MISIVRPHTMSGHLKQNKTKPNLKMISIVRHHTMSGH